MSRTTVLCCLALSAGASSVHAAPGGAIGVLSLGRYACELPGDALGPAGLRQSEADFRITFGSTYRTGAGQGTYLITGERVVFTSGPMKGATFLHSGSTFLRQTLGDGTPGRLRCIRQGGLTR